MRCSHCQLEYDDSQLSTRYNEQGEELHFCCNGCESVYFLLQDCSLTSFYDKLTSPLAPPTLDTHNDLKRFDTDAFMQKYVHTITKDDAELCEVHLIISGIHCAACIWLNEKILLAQEGIISASINYTNNKASIVWDRNKLPLSAIVALIQSIGYDAYVYDSRIQESADKKQMKEYYIRVIVALFCTMNIMWVAIAQYSGYFLGITKEAKDILNLASFILCTPALFYSGWVFFRSSYYGLKNGFVGMDLLVAVGSTLTYIYSLYAALTRSGETYFESVSMIITFVLIGKFLEVRARKNAGDSLDKLSHLLPTSIELCDKQNPHLTHQVAPEEVQIGDMILVRAGEKIAIDGILLSQRAIFDTKAISGESLPIESKKGDEILSGYVNLNHQIFYQATKIFSQSLMSHIIALVSSSLNHRPHIQNLANSLSQYFSRIILSIALLCFLGWYFVGNVGAEKSLMIAISVIIIACPCALALATPIASVVGIGESYHYNILFKQARFLESLAKANIVVFDKTGTLTQGAPRVQKCHIGGSYDKDLLLAFVRLSKHPVAEGIVHFLQSQNDINQSDNTCNAPVLEQFEQFDAQGISAYMGDCKLVGGNLAFLRAQGFAIPKLSLGGGMIFGFGMQQKDTQNQSEICEIFELYDEPKPYAKTLIESLHQRGIATALLSGDRIESVEQISSLIAIQESHHSLSPLQKADWIESYRQKHPQNVLVMVGDGINDAPALSKSDIAISMGAGSDIAILSSDVVILDDKLTTLHNAFEIAHRTYSSIKQNIILSIGYNALSVPLAVAGLVIPLFAALSMSFSSLIVVLNSMRLKHFKGITLESKKVKNG
ncbi:heavy metal translocating P-type ATPase [Helicobacter sp. MIT 21-1697]|uniref:heavy metal translocating P-type ATPase n=1 Tax=Helicobacter sp. MIT 21-1697 TaxID=2993733 RepID=UPI00224AA697|nr:heavy metal translocating P-type ATPase [Helicobacter sp. MIT 21-1697]MCX2717733.1 heavy metal translocating P-type ATPase [Helicobacter sp. MIT 21-1697]